MSSRGVVEQFGRRVRNAGREVSERGVSPVVGGAILIGIVVVLASVIGTFVFSFGPSGEMAPDTTLGFEERHVGEITDNQNNRWRDVLALEIRHESGDRIRRDEIRIQHEPDIGSDVTGYALGIRVGDNVTAPRWNSKGGDVSHIGAGESTRYYLYMTEQIGTHGEFEASRVSRAWESDRCTIERFGKPRETATTPIGVLNFSSGGPATDACPAPSNGYNVTASEVTQAGRIRAGDQTAVVWKSRRGSSTTLEEHEIESYD